MNSKIKIALADDHELFRKGMKALLSDYPEIEIVAEASNGKELISQIAKTKFDMVLLDLQMPVMDGVETAEYLQAKHPDIKVIIVTMHNEEGFIHHLISKGARGFLLKNQEIEVVVEAIHAVNENGYYFNETTSLAMIKGLVEANEIKPVFNVVSSFTEKELEVIHLISKEKTNKEIAELLFLSPRTIETHRENILKKTKAKNSIGIVMYALKHKII